MEKKSKGISIPHVYIMFMLVMLVVVALSWIVPSGQYERMPDPNNPAIQVVNPAVFNYVDDAKPIGILDFFTAMHKGVVQSGDIIVMLLIAVGSLYLLEKSGAMKAGIHALIGVAEGKEVAIIAALITVFAVLGTIGFAEGGIPFIPLAMSVVMGMGYDRITGFATAATGLCVGFSAGVLNFYTTGVSQMVVGLPLYSGLGFRIVGLVVFVVISILYVLQYAKKIRRDPDKSVVAEEYKKQLEERSETVSFEKEPFTARRKLALILLGVLFVMQAYGAIKLGWGMPHLSAIYIIYALVLVVVLQLKPNQAAIDFGYGASRLLPAALAIGFARGVMILMDQAKIVDTAIHSLANLLQGKPMGLTLMLLFLSVVIFNFFVVSGSGKAIILMPIMSPLGKILGINQQVMVLLYQYGDGPSNYLWPTSGGLMGALGMCDVKYEDWVKFSLRYFVILHIAGFVLVMLAHMINYGPF